MKSIRCCFRSKKRIDISYHYPPPPSLRIAPHRRSPGHGGQRHRENGAPEEGADAEAADGEEEDESGRINIMQKV
ncbi:MAG: hypothetical protein O8C58_03400 [Candidatus Methanoperedens sp.]|nr:hypothetical protein [Candidatus Methanoperedens sp.]